jgi:hypothetical protein
MWAAMGSLAKTCQMLRLYVLQLRCYTEVTEIGYVFGGDDGAEGTEIVSVCGGDDGAEVTEIRSVCGGDDGAEVTEIVYVVGMTVLKTRK